MYIMAQRRTQIKYAAAVLLISLQITTATPAKNIARPVTEVINEQARIDEKPRNNGFLPYGNPLAGNSRQNAKLHAQNQQAMFNAERVRQHRAQLQRWTKAPQKLDSYMAAYHESQENHHLALEKQQANLKENKQINTATKPTPKARQPQSLRSETVKRSPKPLTEPTKLTKADAVLKYERNRSHRSYGSVEYKQYVQPKRYQTVYVSPAPTYDQGVTIKPNGNVGLAQLKTATEETKLYTEFVPSKTQFVYPKQYHQMQSYQSAQDIDTLSSLLKKEPNEQLTELSALLKSPKHNSEANHDNLETPIDLYFYLKDQPKLPQFDQTKYAQIANYADSYYVPEKLKDHTPITEEVDDIEDPNKHVRPRPYGLQPVLATQPSEVSAETAATKNNNYYKVEVASQTVSAPYGSGYKTPVYYKQEEKPTYQALQYTEEPVKYQIHSDHGEEDLNEKYLHHNAKHTGIHHLIEDGTGVSAYGSENLHYAANYEFGYRVKDHHSGNDFGHHEAKKGDKTKGHYHVLLPDGRMQQVKYSAGPEGFHADISYDHLHR